MAEDALPASGEPDQPSNAVNTESDEATPVAEPVSEVSASVTTRIGFGVWLVFGTNGLLWCGGYSVVAVRWRLFGV